MDSNQRDEKDEINTCDDSSKAEIPREKSTDCDSDRQDKELSQSKAISFPHTINAGKIEEGTREKLKSLLNSCLKEHDNDYNLVIKAFDSRLKALKDVKDDLNLSEGNDGLNKPDPDIFHEECPPLLVDQSVNLKQNNSKSNQASSSHSNILSTGNKEINTQDEESKFMEIKQEFNQVHDLSHVECSNGQEELNDAPEDAKLNNGTTPKKSASLLTGQNTPIGSVKRSRRFNNIEKTNRKITDYFTKTSKSRTPVDQKSKRENLDPSFLQSALKGDPNYCIICDKRFKYNYLKKHLVEQHGIDKESIHMRPIKREKIPMNNLIIDFNDAIPY